MKVESDPYEQIQTGWGLLNLNEAEEIFELRGKGFVEFLNNYNTQDVQGLPTNHVTLGAFLTQKGKIISDSLILKFPDKFLLIWQRSYGEKILKHLELYLNFADVEFKDVSQNFSHWVCLGKSKPVGILQELPPAELNSSIQTLSFRDQSLWAFSTDRFGPPAWEILGPAAIEADLIKNLQDAGAFLVSESLAEILRIEAGLPKIGLDMDDTNLVAEVGLDRRATSFNKGCYLGQETTARVESQGHVNKKLQLLRLEKPIAGDLPLEIFQGEQKVGKITSTTLSPKYDGPIALGILQRKALDSKGDLRVQDKGHWIGAQPLEP